MSQIIGLLALLGILVPTLRERGVSWVILAPGALLAVVLLHGGIGMVGKLIPVRCRGCGGRGRFHGFGLWPFIYKYACERCGWFVRFELQG
jgi:hypothetical protein